MQSIASVPRLLSVATAARPAKRGRGERYAGAAAGGGERDKGGANGAAATGVCYQFNSASGCQRTRCKFAHKCGKCGSGDHAELACKKTV
jgi:hypothetical protein